MFPVEINTTVQDESPRMSDAAPVGKESCIGPEVRRLFDSFFGKDKPINDRGKPKPKADKPRDKTDPILAVSEETRAPSLLTGRSKLEEPRNPEHMVDLALEYRTKIALYPELIDVCSPNMLPSIGVLTWFKELP